MNQEKLLVCKDVPANFINIKEKFQMMENNNRQKNINVKHVTLVVSDVQDLQTNNVLNVMKLNFS